MRAGTLIALASGGRERSPALPEVPTLWKPECPASGRCHGSAFCAVPHRAAIVDKLAGAVMDAMQQQNVKDVLAQDARDRAA